MNRPTVTIETLGSMWLIDEINMVYLRMPKHEGPRENGWGDASAGGLQDLVWHPFLQWEIDDYYYFGQSTLIIQTTETGGGLIAPDAEIRSSFL